MKLSFSFSSSILNVNVASLPSAIGDVITTLLTTGAEFDAPHDGLRSSQQCRHDIHPITSVCIHDKDVASVAENDFVTIGTKTRSVFSCY